MNKKKLNCSKWAKDEAVDKENNVAGVRRIMEINYYHIWMIMENTQIKIESRVPILENFGCLVNNKEVALK